VSLNRFRVILRLWTYCPWPSILLLPFSTINTLKKSPSEYETPKESSDDDDDDDSSLSSSESSDNESSSSFFTSSSPEDEKETRNDEEEEEEKMNDISSFSHYFNQNDKENFINFSSSYYGSPFSSPLSYEKRIRKDNLLVLENTHKSIPFDATKLSSLLLELQKS